jgi:flagellar basal-body rod protein FlgC
MFGALDAASTGVTLGRTWMDVISDNVANANTVRPGGEEPFRAKMVVAEAQQDNGGVAVTGLREAAGAPDVVFDPENPLADDRGYVTHPKVDMTEEMTNMLMATRLYQANLSVMQQARDSYAQALRLGSGA